MVVFEAWLTVIATVLDSKLRAKIVDRDYASRGRKQ